MALPAQDMRFREKGSLDFSFLHGHVPTTVTLVVPRLRMHSIFYNAEKCTLVVNCQFVLYGLHVGVLSDRVWDAADELGRMRLVRMHGVVWIPILRLLKQSCDLMFFRFGSKANALVDCVVGAGGR